MQSTWRTCGSSRTMGDSTEPALEGAELAHIRSI